MDIFELSLIHWDAILGGIAEKSGRVDGGERFGETNEVSRSREWRQQRCHAVNGSHPVV